MTSSIANDWTLITNNNNTNGFFNSFPKSILSVSHTAMLINKTRKRFDQDF